MAYNSNNSNNEFHLHQVFTQSLTYTEKQELTPVLQMEVGCSKIWGLKPTTQTQVGVTPHKPALTATQHQTNPAPDKLYNFLRVVN